MLRLVVIFATISTSLILPFNANAWMDEWAPAFKGDPVEVQVLPEATVSNFVCSVKKGDIDWDFDNWEYCKGYSIDLNGDGIKDSLFIVPWFGNGALAGYSYEAHFRVSTGSKSWVDTAIECLGNTKADLVEVAGTIYFRHSMIYGGFEKSQHNHFVHQLFSFDKSGAMVCRNGDFGKLFPAVTIYYINPKFKQIELTKKDLREIEDKTKSIVRQIQQSARATKEGFDFLNYRYLWNDDAEKARMIINPASKKKEADDWKPRRKLTEAECTKLIRIMTDRFGEPAKCRNGYASFVYVWRFEGDEWLSVGVGTMANMGGDPIAIFHWDWRKPELSVHDEEEAKAREYPIVQIDKEGLPPAAFFEFFNPYPSIKDGETEKNLITEFNVTKYLETSDYTRCTAEWDAVERRYDIYTEHPDKWRSEYDACKGSPHGGHTNEYHVGVVQFYKLASDLYMCYSLFVQDGTMGPDRVRYLFEVYDRDIWSVDSDKPIRSKLVRYLGAIPINEVMRFRLEWIDRKNIKSRPRICEILAQGYGKPFSEERAALLGSPYNSSPRNAKLLAESGALALFSGETAQDSAYNEKSTFDTRNSLFLRLRRNGVYEWRMLLTTGSDWREVDGMSEWCSIHAGLVKSCFHVYRASFASDGHRLWLVCGSNFATFTVVCSYDANANTLRVLIDGDTADEQPDGTILVKGKKTFLNDENGKFLGARWYDAWIDPDGKIVKKGKLMTIEELMEGAEFVPNEEVQNGQ